MCARYFFDEGVTELAAILRRIFQDKDSVVDPAAMKTGEVFPTNVAPVLTSESPRLMKWGFSRYDGKGQVINARVETADEKPMFRREFAAQRCLIPASCYFEWEKSGSETRKYAIGRGYPVYMAGLYRYEGLSPLPHFVILTRPAERAVSFIHPRMPVLIPGENRDGWLLSRIGAPEVLSITLGDLLFEAV